MIQTYRLSTKRQRLAFEPFIMDSRHNSNHRFKDLPTSSPTNLRSRCQAQFILHVRLLACPVVALLVAAAAQAGSLDPMVADDGSCSSSLGLIKGSFECYSGGLKDAWFLAAILMLRR